MVVRQLGSSSYWWSYCVRLLAQILDQVAVVEPQDVQRFLLTLQCILPELSDKCSLLFRTFQLVPTLLPIIALTIF